MSGLVQAFAVKKLQVKIFSDRKQMGRSAGQAMAEKIREILRMKEALSMVFASAMNLILLHVNTYECPL